MEMLILNQLDQARKLYSRIQNTVNSKNNLSIDLFDCADSLHKIKISTSYQKKNKDLSKEETMAIDEICQINESVQEIMGKLQD